MQNKKKLSLVFCLVALLVVGMLCLTACTKKETRGTVTFEGVEEIHAPVGTVTEESLLAGVTAKDSNGKSKEVTLNLGDADLTKPGRYLIEYKAGDNVKREAVYLYGDISFQINGQNLEGDKLEIPFATAITSLHFAKIASATDSFGNEITTTLVEGEQFDYSVGEYTVKYSATDKAGQTVEKTVTYVVTSDIEMTVQSDVSVKYEQESVSFKIDLDGEKDVWLMANGGLVGINDYLVTEKSLELKASYYRTLTPGENTLKICSVNGSTEFTFTVVDTGKPLFTFDSIYTTNIIAGNAAVYEMPQSQIAGHEYSYTFKVTKGGVTYKAQQVGDSVLFTTSSGKNLTPGIYDVTVTATNKADTSKKTTIKRDFRIYTNQKEIDGWQFWHSPSHVSMVNVDLSEYGYYRTSYKYDAKSPGSWNTRMQWNGATKETFQNVTFDFYVYSLGIAEVENGPVKYVGKNGLASIPFSASTMSGEGIAMMFYDMNGKVVDKDALKMNTWYTVKLDMSEFKNEKTDIYWANGVSNKWQVGMYITEMHFWAYEGSGTQNVFRDDAKTATIQRNGGKSSFTSGKVDDENVWLYTVSEKHMPSTPLKRALKVTTGKSKEVISIDFKFLEDPKDVHGNVLKPSMFVHDVDYRNDFVFGANYTIVDETGDPVETPEVGKWYTLYITTQGRENYLIYPMAEITEQITCKMAYKNLQTYDLDLGNVTMRSDFGNVSRVSLYKNGEGNWEYSFMSYTGWSNYPNDPWRRRPLISVSGDVSEVRFQFMFETADYLPKESTVYRDWLELFASVEGSGPSHPALTTTILDENYNPMKQEDLQKGVWYTAVVTTNSGVNLQPQFNLLPGGSSKTGGTDDQVFNIEMKIRDLIGVPAEDIPVYNNGDNTATIERKGSKSKFEPVEGAAGSWLYTVENSHVPSSTIQRALKVHTSADKEVISIDFKYVSQPTNLNGDPLSTNIYVHDVDLRSDGVFGANYAIVDANGAAVAYPEVGQWYTLYITTKGRENYLIYPLGQTTEQVLCNIEFKNLQTHDLEETNVDFRSDNGNFARLSWVKDGEGKWQYSYLSYTDLAVNGSNATWYRRPIFRISGEAAELRFQYKFTKSDYMAKVEDGFTYNPEIWASVEGSHPALVTTIYDENYNVVAPANRELNKWYYVVVARADGKPFEHPFNLLVGGYADGTEGKIVNIEMEVRDVKTIAPNGVYTMGDMTFKSAGAVDALKEDNGAIRYVMDKDAVANTTFPSDRAIKVDLTGETRGLVKMELVLNSAKDLNDQDVKPWLQAEVGGWNKFVVTDTNGDAVKYLEAGKTYYLFVTTGDNASFVLYPTGKNGEKIAADLTIKSATVKEITATAATISAPENFANVSYYEDANGLQFSYQSDPDLKAGNTAWRRRMRLVLDSAEYMSLSFQIRYVESLNGEATVHSLMMYESTVTYYDDDFNVVPESELQNGVWYNAVMVKKDGTALRQDCDYHYQVSQSDAQPARVLFQLRNFKGAIPEATTAQTIADGAITIQAGGAFETLSKDETTGKLTYKLVSEKAPYSSVDKGIKLTLTDTTKNVIELKFTVSAANTLGGDPTTAWVRVDNKSGYDGNYAVIDADGNLCKNVEAGKTYSLFITCNENIREVANLHGQPASSSEFVVYLMGKDGPQIAELTIDEAILHEVSAITAEDKAITYTTHVLHNNVSYYRVGEKWNLAFAGITSLYRGSPTPTNCTAEARSTSFILPEGNYDALVIRMRFVEADNNGVLDVNFASWAQSVAFYQNGVAIPAADRKLNEWYDVVIIKSGGFVEKSGSYYAQGYSNGTTANPTSVVMQMADFQLLEPDTNPVKVVVRDATNLNMFRKVVNGENVYVTTTRGVSNPGTGAWQWGTGIEVPLGNKYFAVTFRIMEAYAADGVTPIDPTMSVWRKDLVSGTTAYIFDAETGAMVSNDNGNYNRGQKLELGKWYTVVSNVPIAENTRHYLFPCQQYTGKALITMEIKDRACVEDISNGVTVTTPDAYANPYPVYTKNDGWHYTIFENGSSYNAWQRRTDFGGAVAGAAQVEFEVRINSISGACTVQFGTTETRREFYDIVTGEFLGYDNNITLEIGKWYKVIATNGDKGDVMGDFFRCYPGNASKEGNVFVSFRNFEVKAAPEGTVSFNLNGKPGTTPDPFTAPGAEAYGDRLPTPVNPTGYTFVGWFKDAAGTGEAVKSTDLIGGSHTLYAKWEIMADTSLLVPSYTTETGFTNVSRDFIDGKDTIIFTTEGKTLINTGWQRRLEFVSSDADKEIVKFRFKYVSNNNTNGEAVAPKINFFVGGLDTSNTGSCVVTDGNGNVVTELTTGVWYTFYGMTRGNTRLVLYPCNSTEQLRTTLYIQDRELLDYEPDIHIRDEVHAYYGNTAAYEDADGNWMYHFRSFTGDEHHGNSGWNRRTYLDVTGDYTHASFEFKYNVATYIAKDAEAVDKVGFGYLGTVVYTDLEGNVVNAADLKVGTWYRATFAVPLANGWFISMGDVNGGGDNTVNIDMDYRNFIGFKSNGITVKTEDAYADPGMAYTEADGWFYHIAENGSTYNAWQRRTDFGGVAGANAVTFEVRINSVSGECTAQLGTTETRREFYEMDGTYLGYDNNVTLEVGKWYKVVAYNGDEGALMGDSFRCYPGNPTNEGNVSVSFRNLATVKEEVTFTTPGSLADPVASVGKDGFEYTITGASNIASNQRKLNVTMMNASATQLEFALKLSNKKGGALWALTNPDSTLNVKFFDANGTEVTTLAADTWFKVIVTKKDGTALGGTALLLGTLGGAPSGTLDVAIRNVVVTAP